MNDTASPDLQSADLSATMRDYLAQVYRLGDEQPGDAPVSTSALADVLGVSPPAVNRMVGKLRDLGLLDHEPYQGIRLTDAGRAAALAQLRRHRVAEAFLVSVMGFAWHEVYDEARQMSATLSPELVARMEAMAGHPATCPHGAPIPADDGTLLTPDDQPLPDAPVDADYTITRVTTRDRGRLEYLGALGLTPGSTLRLLHAAPYHGPLQLRLNGEYRIVGHNLAEMIRVVPGVK